MLRLLLNQAQFNGFEFRRWYVSLVQTSWPGTEQALTLLASEGRHYTLLFSHDFVQYFWRSGAQISFMVPGTSYSRVTANGEVVNVTRKPFTRRIIKPNVWKYHLQQMAISEDPLDYVARFLPPQDQMAIRSPRPKRAVAHV
jgi:hypothetical protein